MKQIICSANIRSDSQEIPHLFSYCVQTGRVPQGHEWVEPISNSPYVFLVQCLIIKEEHIYGTSYTIAESDIVEVGCLLRHVMSDGVWQDKVLFIAN